VAGTDIRAGVRTRPGQANGSASPNISRSSLASSASTSGPGRAAAGRPGGPRAGRVTAGNGCEAGPAGGRNACAAAARVAQQAWYHRCRTICPGISPSARLPPAAP